MKYSQIIIYYFSGTGNAMNAAKWIIERAKKKGVKTELISVDRLKTTETPSVFGKTLIGFCTPTHGFNVPPIMLKFIRKFPKLKNTDAFILNTRGGLKLHKFFIPGLSGLAQLLPAFLLLIKGFRIVGMHPLDLPSNWLILHPGVKPKVIQSIYSRCKPIVNAFADKILSGKRKYKALLSVPIDLTLIPLTIGYYFIGRFFFAKTLIATDVCDGCEVCIKKCPVESIVMVNNRPFWRYNCESCMRCANICPKRAIETAHTYVGFIIIISSLILTPFILKGLRTIGLTYWFERNIFTQNLLFLINSIAFLILCFISYGILHFFMRYRSFARVIAYTSLSKYNFWRRYKSPKHL